MHSQCFFFLFSSFFSLFVPFYFRLKRKKTRQKDTIIFSSPEMWFCFVRLIDCFICSSLRVTQARVECLLTRQPNFCQFVAPSFFVFVSLVFVLAACNRSYSQTHCFYCESIRNRTKEAQTKGPFINARKILAGTEFYCENRTKMSSLSGRLLHCSCFSFEATTKRCASSQTQ